MLVHAKLAAGSGDLDGVAEKDQSKMMASWARQTLAATTSFIALVTSGPNLLHVIGQIGGAFRF